MHRRASISLFSWLLSFTDILLLALLGFIGPSIFYYRTARDREKWHPYVLDPSDMIIDSANLSINKKNFKSHV